MNLSQAVAARSRAPGRQRSAHGVLMASAGATPARKCGWRTAVVTHLLWAGLCAAPCTAQITPGTATLSESAQRGRALLLQRHETGCILCHTVPGLPLGGHIGPPLTQLASRFSERELSERIADARLFNPQTVMPPYRSTEGLAHVAPEFKGKPVLSAQALADIVSYLLSGPENGSPTSARHPSARP